MRSSNIIFLSSKIQMQVSPGLSGGYKHTSQDTIQQEHTGPWAGFTVTSTGLTPGILNTHGSARSFVLLSRLLPLRKAYSGTSSREGIPGCGSFRSPGVTPPPAAETAPDTGKVPAAAAQPRPLACRCCKGPGPRYR